MKSSLQKNFAIAFYRYRMWLEEQQTADKATLLRDTNHFLAYLTFSSTDFSKALRDQRVLQKGLSAYRRFLRDSMNTAPADIELRLQSVKNFCDFNVWSAASVAAAGTCGIRAKSARLSGKEHTKAINI